jgi:hypothetical protein
MANWTICHFCKRFKTCERWFDRWRCSDCGGSHSRDLWNRSGAAERAGELDEDRRVGV